MSEDTDVEDNNIEDSEDGDDGEPGSEGGPRGDSEEEDEEEEGEGTGRTKKISIGRPGIKLGTALAFLFLVLFAGGGQVFQPYLCSFRFCV